MAQRLFDTIQSANAPPSQSHTGSNESQPSLLPTTNSQPTTTDIRNATSPPADSAHEQNILPQHLANLLLQAASQLSAMHRLIALTQAQMTPQNNPTPQPSQQPTAVSNAPFQQDADQLSDVSAFIPTTTQPPGTLTFPTVPTYTATINDINPNPASSLPPVPTCLRDRIMAGEFIDFNSLLTSAMFSTHDGQSHHHSSAHSLTPQMAPQSGEFQVAPTPTSVRKINSFALWMEAWNIYASTLLSAKPSRALELFGY